MLDNILSLIKSDSFRSCLTNINKNYSNLKQENHIRNCILEILNKDILSSTQKAFAEHPRQRGQRVDLSIVTQPNVNNPYTIELKFQYTNDFKQFLAYDGIVRKDFEKVLYDKGCDMFILIISHWDKNDKLEYDEKWGIRTEYTLSKYLSLNDMWQDNVKNMFSKFEAEVLTDIPRITVSEPYTTHYHFYIMTRLGTTMKMGS